MLQADELYFDVGGSSSEAAVWRGLKTKLTQQCRGWIVVVQKVADVLRPEMVLYLRGH
jgi:hypothetical protein